MIEQALWFVGGFLGGCLATYLFLIKLALDPHLEHLMTATDTPSPKPKRRFTLLHVIGLVVIGLTIASSVQAWLAQQATTRLTDCLVRFANDTAVAIDARGRASAEAQVAGLQVWRAIFNTPQTDEGRAAARKVFEDYLNKQEEAIKTQREHPFPAAPRTVCPESAR